LISEYLDESFPDQNPLFPKDPYEKARLKVWVDHITTRILPNFHRVLQHTEKSQYSLEKASGDFQNALKTWIQEADPEGPYFLGKEFSYADVALAPWAVRLWVLEHFKGVAAIPAPGQGGTDEEIWNRWRKWSQAVESRKSVAETLSDRDRYLPLYQRYAEDKAQSELAKAIREGRGVP
jgi:glutathione S-transferase